MFFRGKKLLERIEDIEKELDTHNKKQEEYRENIRKRDYLISTNFLGKVKNKKLIDKIKNSEFYMRYYPHLEYPTPKIKYEDIVEEIKIFNFTYLDDLYYLVNECERDQRILDKYDGGKA